MRIIAVGLAILIATCGIDAGGALPEFGVVYGCRFNDGVSTTTDRECLPHDGAVMRVQEFKAACQSDHEDPLWFCDAECTWSGLPDLCVVPST